MAARLPTSAWIRTVWTSPWLALVVVSGLLAGCWGVAYAVGGAGVAAPHWFYVPIAVAASRFGHVGASVTALFAGVLAGPLLPLDTTAGEAQQVSDWVVRMLFFVFVGQFIAWLIAQNRGSQRDLGATTQRLTILKSLLERQTQDRTVKRWAVERLRATINAGGPEIVYQPVVDLADGRITGVEALARFNVEPRRGPNFWFEQAWLAGIGIELELAALAAAVRTAEPLLAKNLRLGVNMSPEVVASEEFRALLPNLPAEQLVIEITEHARIDDYEALMEPIHSLRGRGGWLAIDDVGAGFANLRHIVALAPDLIKLDVSLTRAIDRDPARQAVTSCLVSLAKEIGCGVVAEGIESRDELAVLHTLGVTRGQGYLLGHPVAVEALDPSRTQRALALARLQATA